MAVLKDLIVHGNSKFLNGASFNTINAESIGAEEGIFNKLIATTLDAKTATIEDLTATNATVVGLLDVQGQMQTNSWTNANIATIDGSFYICPTISSVATVTTSGTTQTSNNKFVYNSSGGTIQLTGTWAVTGSLYLNDTATDWHLYSRVMITGEVLIGTEWTPIGTIRGTLTGMSSTTLTIGSLSTNITPGSDGTINSAPAILSLVTSGTSYNARKLKVSMYEYNSAGTSSGATNLIGIMMTTAGTHGFTYLDIYNGEYSKTSYTSTIDNQTKGTIPMVRIGNLNGLPNIITGSTDEETQPTGWGIYTTNGFFQGRVVADAGLIAGWHIGLNALYSGTESMASTNPGTYIGAGQGTNSGIRNYLDANTYVNISEGVIEAKGVKLTGEITATSGTIGGLDIDENGNIQITGNNISLGGNSLGAFMTIGTQTENGVSTEVCTFGNDHFKITISDQQMSFYSGDTQTAYISGQNMFIPAIVVANTMKAGNWLWDAEVQPSHLTLKWNG